MACQIVNDTLSAVDIINEEEKDNILYTEKMKRSKQKVRGEKIEERK